MKPLLKYLLPSLLVLLACTAVALAQDEEIETYTQTWSAFPQILNNGILSVVYIGIYAAAALIPLGYLKLYNGFETEMFYWIGGLWAGGMVINALAHAIIPSHAVAVLVTIPLIFGWSVFMNTRNAADLALEDAWKIAVVIALVCAPYFGPTWQIRPPQNTQATGYRVAATQTECLAVPTITVIGVSELSVRPVITPSEAQCL